MLLLHNEQLESRRQAVGGPLQPLLRSLVGELEPVLDRAVFIPPAKALLSRAGGRCERDGANLEFDPFSPVNHRCGACGAVYTGELHSRAWNTWYHLWLAERAVHAALFHLIETDARRASFARDVLRKYAAVYLEYPNRDNVLGPTRPFFSTYLESIWLLQICVAADFVEQTGDHWTADIVRERIIAPSRALISGFNEGNSNRQVWNNVALLASALMLRDKSRADAVVGGKFGVAAHLDRALLADGTWFEGDNYHQFAIRGLWYAVTMCEANGIPLSAARKRNFDRGIAATFASALPDFTFPSRKDSQYAVSLRQWRFAELAELGLARTGGDELHDAVARCYEPGHERGDTGRSRSTADAERNTGSSLLTRADLGWRAVLHAVPELPATAVVEPRSVHLTGQGLAIFRRPGRVFVAMDYGQSGAGHGHPDRLNLLLVQGMQRWLDDLGTGSYVEKSLHWYRSSLAHNAPFVGGHSQQSADGRLTAYDERGDLGWAEAQFTDGDVTITRALIVTPRYLVDELTWTAPRDVQVDLPWHVDAVPEGVELRATTVDGADGLEDGFDFARDWSAASVKPGESVLLHANAGERRLRLWFQARGAATLIRGEAPGQPASQMRPFYMVRLRGAQGRLRTLLAWDPAVASCAMEVERVRVESGGERHTHLRTPSGWRMEVGGTLGAVSTELGGRVAATRSTPVLEPKARRRIRQPANFGGWWSDLPVADRKRLYTMELGENNYRRSEVSWREAGSPSATVAVSAADNELELFIDVRATNQRFAPADAVNRLDNEHADTMGAGIQVHIDTTSHRARWMLVPEIGSEHVRVREIAGSVYPSLPVARWRPNAAGYELHVVIPDSLRAFDRKVREAGTHHNVDLTIVVNDAVAGRERRRGQLVTGDARGEFAYLRGDREDDSHALHLDVVL
ncbi:MAG: heparinase II/III family protein [Gemmatimonadota bacterium]